jgi:hypothetical protein
MPAEQPEIPLRGPEKPEIPLRGQRKAGNTAARSHRAPQKKLKRTFRTPEKDSKSLHGRKALQKMQKIPAISRNFSIAIQFS